MAQFFFDKMHTTTSKNWSGSTSNTHLYNIFNANEQVLSSVVDMLYEVNYGSNDLISLVRKFPKVYIEDEGKPFTWYLQDRQERRYTLVTATLDDMSTAPTEPCRGGSTIWLHFNEKCFKPHEVIVGENPDFYQFFILEERPTGGGGYAFKVQLMTSDLTLVVPASEIAANTEWTVESALASHDLSRDGGMSRHSAPFKMQNRVSHVRLKEKFGGAILNGGKADQLFIPMVDPDGKKHMSWLTRADWDFMYQYNANRARQLVYGKSNILPDGTSNTIDPTSGMPIYTGYCLLEQIAAANTFTYNTFSAKVLEEVGRQLTFGKIHESNRHLVVVTGEEGAILFHEAIEAVAGQITYLRDNTRIRNSGEDYSLVGQFVSYSWLNGLKYSLMIDHSKDDDIRNKKTDSQGRLLKSMEMEIFDLGTSKNPNIQLVEPRNNGSYYFYREGARSPFSTSNDSRPGARQLDIDGWEIQKGEFLGIQVNNPMRCARIIPSYS